MEFDELILDRMKLRRAAISQISGEQVDALDRLVAEQQQKMRERRDRRITWLTERRNELDKDAGGG
jgi:hypothetical protein